MYNLEILRGIHLAYSAISFSRCTNSLGSPMPSFKGQVRTVLINRVPLSSGSSIAYGQTLGHRKVFVIACAVYPGGTFGPSPYPPVNPTDLIEEAVAESRLLRKECGTEFVHRIPEDLLADDLSAQPDCQRAHVRRATAAPGYGGGSIHFGASPVSS